MAFTATTDPTSAGATLGSTDADSWYDGKVMSYAVSSAVEISKGDFVKLADTTTNTITKCNSSVNDTQFIGVAIGDLDNSTGTAASSTKVGVLRKGLVMVDVLVASSGKAQDDIVYYDSLLYLAKTEDGVSTTSIGQALVATANGVPIARSLDYITVPSASTLFKGRIYIDALTKALFVE